MADRLCSNIPVDKELDLSRMDNNVMEDKYVGCSCDFYVDGVWRFCFCIHGRYADLGVVHITEWR